jgi:hypothetical protein
MDDHWEDQGHGGETSVRESIQNRIGKAWIQMHVKCSWEDENLEGFVITGLILVKMSVQENAEKHVLGTVQVARSLK